MSLVCKLRLRNPVVPTVFTPAFHPVMLQPLKEEPPLNSKCKDKFLVQSTLITPEKETMALHDLVSAEFSLWVPFPDIRFSF